MSLLNTFAPVPARGVVRLNGTCEHCSRPVPVLGRPGKGRPLHTFAEGYLCRGHAVSA